jgi:hypothetical protein
MTSEKKPATENDALEKKIGAIEKEVATVKVAIRRSSRTRLLLLVAALVIIGVAIGMFWNLAKELGSKENLDLLANKAGERAKDTTDRAVDHAKALAENAVPVLQKAFTEQVNKDMPKYRAALDREGMALKENLETELDKKIRAHVDEASVKYQAILREEFPDLENPELLDKMYASITDIMDRLANEYYNEKVAQALEGINDKWLKFEMAELPAEGEPSFDRQFIASLMYLAALKIDEGSVD